MSITRFIAYSMILGSTTSAWALPNPAAQFCTTAGGQQEIVLSPEGEWALCNLDEGSIEAWTLYRYASGLPSMAVQTYRTHPEPSHSEADDPRASYCAQVGGTALNRTYRTGGNIAICQFSDKSVIGQETLWQGPSGPGHERLNAVLEHYAS